MISAITEPPIYHNSPDIDQSISQSTESDSEPSLKRFPTVESQSDNEAKLKHLPTVGSREKCVSYISRYAHSDTIDDFYDSTATTRSNYPQHRKTKNNSKKIKKTAELLFDQLTMFVLMMLSLLYLATSLIIQLGYQAYSYIQLTTHKIHSIGFLCASETTRDWRNRIHNLLTSARPWETKLRKILKTIKDAPSTTATAPTRPSSKHFKYELSTPQTLRHQLLKNFEKRGDNLNHHIHHQAPVYPIQISRNLPCIIGKVGNRNIPFLVDSGCYHSLIPKNVVTEFEKEFYTLPKFQHNTSLLAHNNSSVPIQDDGVIIPVRLTDTDNQSRVIQLQFLVETSQNHQPIIGYRDIKSIGICPTHNITFANLKTDMKHTYKSHSIIQLPDQLPEVSDGPVLLQYDVALNCCNIKHVKNVPCQTAAILSTNDLLLKEFEELLGYCPLLYTDQPISDRVDIKTVKDGRILEENLNIDQHLVEITHLEDEDYFTQADTLEQVPNELYPANERNTSNLSPLHHAPAPDTRRDLSPHYARSSDVSRPVDHAAAPDTERDLFQPSSTTCNSPPAATRKFTPARPPAATRNFSRPPAANREHTSTREFVSNIYNHSTPASTRKSKQNYRKKHRKKKPRIQEPLSYKKVRTTDVTLNTCSSTLNTAHHLESHRNDTVTQKEESNSETQQYDRGNSLRHSAIGITQELIDPASIRNFNAATNFEDDFRRCVNLSNPLLEDFLKSLFDCFDKIYSKHSTDLGKFLNPNYKLDLDFKEGCGPESLPRDKPFPIPIYFKKACARILQNWQDSGIITKSNIKTHASRTVLAKKALNPSNFEKIKSHLRDKHNITGIEDQEELYRLDPDVFTDTMISQLFRLCLDGRGLNMAVQPLCPLQQNSQSTLFDLVANLGLSEDPLNPNKMKIQDPESLRPPANNKQHFLGESWTPVPHSPEKMAKVYNYLQQNTKLEESEKGLYFSSLDQKSAHNLVQTTEKSRYLLNFISPLFSYHTFTLSPFGLQGISNVYNWAMQDIFGDLAVKNLVIIYADDILVLSRGNLKDHCILLIEICRRLQENGVKLQLGKCFFGVKKFRYLGFEFTQDGIFITPERVKAITQFQPPTNLKALQRFLGSIQYISWFVPHLAQKTADLTDLLRKNNFKWSPIHEKAFFEVITELKNNLKLNYIDKTKKLNLYTDANAKGTGAVLFQGERGTPSYAPVLFLSRKFSYRQSITYNSLEREIFAMLDALERLKYFVNSESTLHVHTDAKCILYCMKATKLTANPRLNRLCARLALYPIKFEISYCKPSQPELKIADTLSRMHDTDESKMNIPTKVLRKIQPEDIHHDLQGSLSFDQIFNALQRNPHFIKLPEEISQSHRPEISPENIINLSKEEDFLYHLYDIYADYDQKQLNKDDFDAEVPEQFKLATHHLIQPLDADNLDQRGILPMLTLEQELSAENIAIEQLKDSTCRDIILHLNTRTDTITDNLMYREFTMHNGLLVKINKPPNDLTYTTDDHLIYLTPYLARLAVGHTHIHFGHIARDKVYEIVRRQYYHPNLHKITMNMVTACNPCQLYNTPHKRYPEIQPYFIPLYPFSNVTMDFFTMPSTQRYNHVLIVMDVYSQFIWLFKTPNQKVIHVIRALESLFAAFGPCVHIQSDNAKNLLRNAAVRNTLLKYGINRFKLSLPHYEQHNASCEREIKSCRKLYNILERTTGHNWVNLTGIVALIHNSIPRLFDNKILLSPFERFLLRPMPSSLLDKTLITNKTGDHLSLKQYEMIKTQINEAMEKKKLEYAEEHNRKANPNGLKIGDWAIYRRLNVPLPGTRPNKTRSAHLERLFLVRDVNKHIVLLEDIVTGIMNPVHGKFCSKYIDREAYFNDLPPLIQRQMGTPLNLNLRLDTRQTILDKLRSNGFLTDKYVPNSLKEDFDIAKIDQENMKLQQEYEAPTQPTTQPTHHEDKLTQENKEKNASESDKSESIPSLRAETTVSTAKSTEKKEEEDKIASKTALSSIKGSIRSAKKAISEITKQVRTPRNKSKIDYKQLNTKGKRY